MGNEFSERDCADDAEGASDTDLLVFGGAGDFLDFVEAWREMDE